MELKEIKKYDYSLPKKLTFHYFIDEKKQLQGVYKDYHDNEQLRYVTNHVDGEIQGECIYYYDNGQLRQSYSYMDGKKQGLERRYYDNGMREYVYNYKDGMKHAATYYNIEGDIISGVEYYRKDEEDEIYEDEDEEEEGCCLQESNWERIKGMTK